MFNKVKEIFQKLVTKKEAPPIEAPYKIEPEIKKILNELPEVDHWAKESWNEKINKAHAINPFA